MLNRLIFPAFALCVGLAPAFGIPAGAQTAPADPATITQTDVAQLYNALRLPEILDVMRQEGVIYGAKDRKSVV